VRPQRSAARHHPERASEGVHLERDRHVRTWKSVLDGERREPALKAMIEHDDALVRRTEHEATVGCDRPHVAEVRDEHAIVGAPVRMTHSETVRRGRGVDGRTRERREQHEHIEWPGSRARYHRAG
jgi:hypothetical protein